MLGGGWGGWGRSYKCDCVSQVARLSANLITALVHCGVLLVKLSLFFFFFWCFLRCLPVQMDVFTCDHSGGPRWFRSIHSGCFHCLPCWRSAWVWICFCKLFIRSGCVYKEKQHGSSCHTTVEFPSVNPVRVTLLVPFPLVYAGLNMRRPVSLFKFLSARIAWVNPLRKRRPPDYSQQPSYEQQIAYFVVFRRHTAGLKNYLDCTGFLQGTKQTSLW